MRDKTNDLDQDMLSKYDQDVLLLSVSAEIETLAVSELVNHFLLAVLE